MKKPDKVFVCNNCGYESSKWIGKCPECNEWGAFEEIENIQLDSSFSNVKIEVKSIDDINLSSEKRLSSGYSEFDRILGGEKGEEGFVSGQVVLLSGDPGIGKTTILLQVLFNFTQNAVDSLYISAEESTDQIGIRSQRLLQNKQFQSIDKSRIKILNAYNLDSIITTINERKPKFVVIDSIQTIHSENASGLPGSISQVKYVSSKLVELAKYLKIVLIIVGHINKDGNVAGPKVLEHLVDTVLQFEGDQVRDLRILRSLKNRFGPTLEVGIFRMDNKGIQEVDNTLDIFDIETEEALVGVCNSVIIEGVRPMVVQVQALTSPTPYSLPKRVAEGISVARLQRIAAILSKYLRLNIAEKDIYIKIGGGLRVQDPAVDLAIAIAIYSSLKNIKIKPEVIAIGELSLSGKISGAIREVDRKKEARRIGGNLEFINTSKIKNISDMASLKVFSSK